MLLCEYQVYQPTASGGLTSWMVNRSNAIGCLCTTNTAPSVGLLSGAIDDFWKQIEVNVRDLIMLHLKTSRLCINCVYKQSDYINCSNSSKHEKHALTREIRRCTISEGYL